jgi:hypothetical protein
MTTRRSFGCAGLAALVVAGCGVEPVELGSETAPIIGGVEDPGHLNVVAWRAGGALCSGTLIAPDVVLTAGHCVIGPTVRGSVVFGPSLGAPVATRSVAQVLRHRLYDENEIAFGLPYDIALVRLTESAPTDIPPMAFAQQPLPASLVGQEVLAVGFGNDVGDRDGMPGTGAGVKRQVLLPVNSLGRFLVRSGNEFVNTCQGDSGGPVLFAFEGVETVVGITSTGPVGCGGNSSQNRVDVYLDDFVYPVLDAWTGPCKFDGSCDRTFECPRTPDPDCDPCQLDGFCATGCPKVDLDCPLGGVDGAVCDTDDDCESRTCVAGLDDKRITYCSRACDPAAELGDECPSPLGQCVAGVEASPTCYFDGPSPGAQGAPCDSAADCRSGICDTKFEICVERCDQGAAEACPDEFECVSVSGNEVCSLARDDGGCNLGTSSASGGWALLAAGILVACWRPRRRLS